jgi:ribonuclease P protein component
MKFPPARRLTRASEIKAVREQGRRLECRAFTLWWRRRPAGLTPAPGPRVCVIASTAAVGHAVRRNRAKRRLREVFRHQQTAVPAGCDLLMIARHGTLIWPLPRLENTFAEACRQIPAPTPEASGT